MLTNLKRRVEKLESMEPHAYKSDVSERIARYVDIMDREDYSSTEEGRMLKAVVEKYAPALAAIEDV